MKIAKWTALMLFVVSLAVWITAANWISRFPLPFYDADGNQLRMVIGYGNVTVGPAGPKFFEFEDTMFGPLPSWGPSSTWFGHPGSVYVIGSYLPAWWLPAVTLPLAAALFIIDRRRRIPPGHGRKCRYDLRGAVSDRCSECGTLIASGATP